MSWSQAGRKRLLYTTWGTSYQVRVGGGWVGRVWVGWEGWGDQGGGGSVVGDEFGVMCWG